MSWNHPHEMARRARTTTLTVVAVFTAIMGAFFRLQVVGTDRYEFQARQNRLRPVTLPAPRGLITDRHGVVLADNIPGFTVSLLVSSPDSLAATLERLAPVAGLSDDQVVAILERHRRAPSDAVVISRDTPFEVVSALEERRVAFPGMVIRTEPKRSYPYGETVAHVVGYINEVTEEELATRAVPGGRYGSLVGRAGAEREYDARLRGLDGRRFVEVDAFGRTVNDHVAEGSEEPEQGETIRLTIDLDLQQYVREQFPEDAGGAVVAMDPQNGDILAMYSAPAFDPNEFIGGVDEEVWERWNAVGNPLINRAVQARYPPASPWKLALAAMAIKRGVATLRTRMPLPCTGGISYYTRYFRCWKVDGHGSLTLAEAIQHSCNVYFYQLGQQLQLQNILADGLEYGFAERTGIDLPGELESIFPASTEYYDRRYGPRGWTRAVTLNLSIGQGENDQTLMNMVRFYSMLAGEKGRAPQPRILADSPVVLPATPELGLDESAILGLRQALVMVVESGTAARSRVASLRIAGKTGTAQNPRGPDHGWFVAFAPADAPTIVVGAIVELGEHGSRVAPIVTRVIARYIRGPDAAFDRPIRLQMPADSAPAPLPLPPDSIMGPVAPMEPHAPARTR